MARQAVVALVVLLSGMTLAGCISGDETPVAESSDDAAEAVATSRTGSITGQVVTIDLEVLVDVEVGLLNRTGGLELTRTDKDGEYTFNELRPGNYRIQMADDCCQIKTVNVVVVAGNVSQVNLQVQRLSAVELRLPYVVSEQWSGFIACGIAIGGQSSEHCAEPDANHEATHRFNVTEGLQEMVVGMDWEPSSQGFGGEMRLEMTGFCTNRCERYFLIGGPPPLTFHVTSNTANNPDKRFDQINETVDMVFETAMAGVSFAYQQEFTVYWHEFYNHGAPGDFNPIPDG